MIRKTLVEKGFGADKDFRWRGGEVSRIEGFSDAVFAFAITLLIVSLEVPTSFEQLSHLVYGFPAFFVTFIAIIGIWYAHYIFFRRFGLKDGITIVLNAALLFVVLFYIYPLKFLATLLISNGLLKRVLGLNIPIQISMGTQENWAYLMMIYGFGFLAVFSILVVLHFHAYRMRDSLGLNKIETFTTRSTIYAHGICAVTALLSLVIVIFGKGVWSIILSGWIYALIGPAQAVHGRWVRKKGGKLKQAASAESNKKATA